MSPISLVLGKIGYKQPFNQEKVNKAPAYLLET